MNTEWNETCSQAPCNREVMTDEQREQIAEEMRKARPLVVEMAKLQERNAQLRTALRETREALVFVIGDHSVPGDCYSSGPVTGTPLDAICPSCRGVAVIARHAGLAEGGERG